jgi:2-hydroxycyclohexanecarboxyl-CoA dehydrogenase
MPTALITGSASLIGAGIARALAADGWELALTDIDVPTLREVAAGLPDDAVVAVEQLDVTDREAVERVVDALAKRHGGIEALVNVAGGNRGLGIPARPFVELTPAQRDRVVEVNLKGLFNVTHAVLPGMLAARTGAIVSIAAARGLRGGPNASIYSACKAAIIVFSQSLALEVAAAGVRVNTVAPGSAPARWKPAEERIRSPLGRETSPDDIGDAVAFLVSVRAAHITGSCLDLSGGTALH